MKVEIIVIRPNLWARVYHMGLKPWILRRVSKKYRDQEIECREMVKRFNELMQETAKKYLDQIRK